MNVRRSLAVILVAGLVVPVGAAAGRTAPPPQVAYWGGSGRAGARIASLDGTVVTTVRAVDYPFLSLNGGLALATREDPSTSYGNVIAIVDARTGTKLATIDDAFIGLLGPGGRSVVFTPDRDGTGGGADDRDPAANSVWYRDVASGREHALVRFRGPVMADRAPLELAVAPTRPLVAVTEGNDADLFVFDLFVARTDVHRVRRLTTDGGSRYPSFSPDGRTIAYVWRTADACRSQVRLIDADGSGRRILARGTCRMSLLKPVWVNERTIVAWWWNRSGPRGLVRIDARTGRVRPLFRGPVWSFAVSRTLHRVVVRLEDFTMRIVDPATGDVTPLSGGRAYRSTVATITGAYEQSS
jgi:dipeptidyl aminopeptidase/acylaminoacyl peptidase